MTDAVEQAADIIRSSGTQIATHAVSVNPARAARMLAAAGLFADDAAQMRINAALELCAYYTGVSPEINVVLHRMVATLTGSEAPEPAEQSETTPGVERQAQWFHDGWQEALADLGATHTALAKQVANNRVLHAELAKLRGQVTAMATHVGALRRLAGVTKHTDPTRQTRYLSSTCATCRHTFNWHTPGNKCTALGCPCSAFADLPNEAKDGQPNTVRELVDAYAAEVAEVGTEYSVIDEREQLAPKAFAALRAVLEACDSAVEVTPGYGIPGVPVVILRGVVAKALEAENG